MATLNSSNITNGNTVEPNDLLQLYDAFKSGGGTTGTYSVSISGSITGSASTATSASFATTASFAVSASRAVSSSFATTASYALNGGGGSGFPFSGAAVITGSLLVSGSGLTVTGSVSLSGSAGYTNLIASKNSILNWAAAGDTGFDGQFVLPLKAPDHPVAGTMYVDVQADPRVLRIYDGSNWVHIDLLY
jgi:hypothetical protein